MRVRAGGLFTKRKGAGRLPLTVPGADGIDLREQPPAPVEEPATGSSTVVATAACAALTPAQPPALAPAFDTSTTCRVEEVLPDGESVVLPEIEPASGGRRHARKSRRK